MHDIVCMVMCMYAWWCAVYVYMSCTHVICNVCVMKLRSICTVLHVTSFSYWRTERKQCKPVSRYNTVLTIHTCCTGSQVPLNAHTCTIYDCSNTTCTCIYSYKHIGLHTVPTCTQYLQEYIFITTTAHIGSSHVPSSLTRTLHRRSHRWPVWRQSTLAACHAHWASCSAGPAARCRHSPGRAWWSGRWTGWLPSCTGFHSGPAPADGHLGPWAGARHRSSCGMYLQSD